MYGFYLDTGIESICLISVKIRRITFRACGRWNGRAPLRREEMGARVSLRNLCLAIRTFAYQGAWQILNFYSLLVT